MEVLDLEIFGRGGEFSKIFLCPKVPPRVEAHTVVCHLTLPQKFSNLHLGLKHTLLSVTLTLGVELLDIEFFRRGGGRNMAALSVSISRRAPGLHTTVVHRTTVHSVHSYYASRTILSGAREHARDECS